MGLLDQLKNIKQSLLNGFKGTPFNPSVFDHPIASKTSWSAQKSGGSNFKTRSLKKISSTKLLYKGSTGLKLFGALFIFFPVFIIVPAYSSMSDREYDVLDFLPILTPLIFSLAGALLIYFGNRPIVIDKQLGYLYKSYKKPTTGINITPGKKWVKLDNVIALQLVSERVSSKNSSYTSYEINFVFEDASRYNVVDHGKRFTIEEDAKTISDFLGVPVWNKMTNETYIPKQMKEDTSDYGSSKSYDKEPFVDLNKDKEVNLDEPYNSLKRRKM